MSDFNADNQKLDAALGCHPSAEVLLSGATTEEANRVAIDLRGIDWSRYFLLAVELDLLDASVQLRSSKSNGRYTTVSSSGNGGGSALASFGYAGIQQVLIPVFYRPDAPINAVSLGRSGCFSGSSGALGETDYFYLDAEINKTLTPGTKFTFWGVK